LKSADNVTEKYIFLCVSLGDKEIKFGNYTFFNNSQLPNVFWLFTSVGDNCVCILKINPAMHIATSLIKTNKPASLMMYLEILEPCLKMNGIIHIISEGAVNPMKELVFHPD